jgi:NAD(P)H-flavin reductase
LQISRAQGHGFGVSRFHGKPLVLALAGSGVAVAKPVASARSTQDLARTFVYLGLRDALDPPGQRELEWLRSKGVSVVLCESGAAAATRPTPAFETEPGRLQDVLRRRGATALAHDVIFAGPDGASQALVQLGFAVHHNHG